MFRISGHADHWSPLLQSSLETSGGLHCDLRGAVAAVGHLPMPKAGALGGDDDDFDTLAMEVSET